MAANNTPISVEGEVKLPFFLDEECLWTTALVSEDIERSHARHRLVTKVRMHLGL